MPSFELLSESKINAKPTYFDRQTWRVANARVVGEKTLNNGMERLFLKMELQQRQKMGTSATTKINALNYN